MISYLCIDRIEGEYLVGELELISIDDREGIKYSEEIPSAMVDLPLQIVEAKVGKINVGDILIAEHENDLILYILCKDENEKKRRIEFLRNVFSKVN